MYCTQSSTGVSSVYLSMVNNYYLGNSNNVSVNFSGVAGKRKEYLLFLFFIYFSIVFSSRDTRYAIRNTK